MNTTRFIAVRHGETEWNLAGKQQGHLDSPLTARGVKQAESLAFGLANHRIDVFYSSDLGRAYSTAQIISRRIPMPILTDSRLRERHLGILQGNTMAEFAKRYPAEAEQFESGDPDYMLPGGESARQRYQRCVECVEDLAERHAGKTVLLVAHGGVLNSMFYKAMQIPLQEPRRFSLLNSSINIFSIQDGDWRLETWGDISHLKGLESLDDN